jgi:alkylhydroperoxidase family enzyme
VRLLSPADVSQEHQGLAEALDASGGFINLYRAMSHSPGAPQRFLALLGALWDGSLSPRLREIAVLSAVAASDAPYPLGWHLLDAWEAGLTDREIDGVIGGNAAGVLSPHEAAVARFARGVAVDARVGDAEFRSVAAFLDERQMVELALLAGLYRMVACVANALEIELDDRPAAALTGFAGDA